MSVPPFEAPHLGGYVPGGDPATFYPDLWAWLVESQGVRSVIDVGCGDGIALRYFEDLGCEAVGVEGVPQADARIYRHDYTQGPFLPWRAEGFDLGWCCEFVEHVEEVYVPNFLTTLRAARVIALTHAEPGQAGFHHVNCQPRSYWQGALAASGFVLDGPLTSEARRLAAENTNPWNHFVRSGLMFRSTGNGPI